MGVRFTWAVGDEVYGRYAALRDDHENNGEAYASFVPKNFLIPTGAGGWHSAQQLGRRAQGRFEVRSAGPGRYGPRWYEWAMIAAGTPRHYLLIRRPLPRTPTTGSTTAPAADTTSTPSTGTDSSPDTSYVYCYVPENSPIRPTLPTLVVMAGRRWPMEETIATGKGPVGWDHHQYRTWTSLCHHTALCGLAMLKATALRAYLENTTAFPSTPTAFSSPPTEDIPGLRTRLFPPAHDRSPESRDEVTIPLSDSPVPVLPDQPCPPNIGYIRLTLNETLRLVGIAHAELSKARMAFHLRWSRWRRRHQAIARWHHYRARLAAPAAPT